MAILAFLENVPISIIFERGKIAFWNFFQK
jgi:hypothetical protein